MTEAFLTLRAAPEGRTLLLSGKLNAAGAAALWPVMTRALEEKPKAIALIDENTCIGCTLCIQACPVDAIVGAAKQMHTIIAPLCTGCELCLPPCPVECISMEVIRENLDNWKWKYPVVEIKATSLQKAA